jgi:hypothetical protein
MAHPDKDYNIIAKSSPQGKTTIPLKGVSLNMLHKEGILPEVIYALYVFVRLISLPIYPTQCLSQVIGTVHMSLPI